ncbi:hypothetical protein BT67DRAFT_446063 [Trichocladium antarcticum]|uniref:TNT domain-containing protein n=1 Tax=Trichocladium antarcticum TaxID=1450529 RepID=A0AAN6UC82_9PEZI|nr:hypothetical protein BT67DRAFT_446063 [Trichocladium antarcticum]
MKLPALLSLALLAVTAAAAPARPPATSDTTPCGRRNTPRYCQGTNFTASLTATYLCGDSRLGPTKLPARSDDLVLAPVLANALYLYDRFGGLCPGEFVKRWFNESEGWWDYPPANGFSLTQPGRKGDRTKPIQGDVTLDVDTVLDRFGGESGTFVSPAGAPYIQRALPPSNLVGFDPAYPYNYRVYTVVKPLVVAAGPIAPWFGQPGSGVQYMLYKSVATLISDGYLRRDDPSVLLP